MGMNASRVEIDGSQFVVRWFGQRAEVIRVSRERRPQIGVMARRAEAAVEQVSGCQAQTIFGDVALMRAELDCETGIDPQDFAKWQRPPRFVFYCEPLPEPQDAQKAANAVNCWSQ